MSLSISISDQLAGTSDILDRSTADWQYCSHIWSNRHLKNATFDAPYSGGKIIKYCYTCRGKIRKYDLRNTAENFFPNIHSTPNTKIATVDNETPANNLRANSINDINPAGSSFKKDDRKNDELFIETNRCIPSISHRVDSSFRQKYNSSEIRHEAGRRRLRKSLKGIRCIVNFALTDSAIKKRTQIQACSISVMIVAIVVISFVLVNFATPSFTHPTNNISTIVVPTPISFNVTSLIVSDIYSKSSVMTKINIVTTSAEPFIATTENISLISNIISKIRKNIKTFSKDPRKIKTSQRSKDSVNGDSTQNFCSCQTNEVCMLDEVTGTSVCKNVVDSSDPTGCGGICALETEACQLVDRARGVRVCRSLTPVTCTPEEWRCRNGLCVGAEARCDGIIQCYDRSDEIHCDCDLTKQFRCGHSISCFPNTKLCNGVIDCWDGFDEFNCTTECPTDQFTCTDGQCILSSRFCDGLADCVDGSDEPRGCGGECSKHEIRCKNHRCVPRAMQCDGHDNCGDATDELHCS